MQDKKLKGGTFTLNENEHNLLREIFIEYKKHLTQEISRTNDRVLIPYCNLAVSDLMSLIKKFNCYEKWMKL